MKVLLVDDEPAMLLAMKLMLSRIEGVELAASFRSGREALDFVKDAELDIAFLDIEIGGDNGLELARALRKVRSDVAIVFTTSHAEYALDAYDVYPLDYMVKPISAKRLAETIDRAASLSRSSSDAAAALPSDRLTVRGFGCFEARSAAGTVRWISKKSMELFAYLLMHQGRSVSKQRILEAIFPNMPLKNSEQYLNTAVYQLRKALSEHGCKEIVVKTQEQYHVDLAQVDVDFIQAEQGMAELTEFSTANAAEAIELERQCAGELFEDKTFEWSAIERERLALTYALFAKRLAGWLLVQKRYSEALLIARKLVSRNEFEEESNLLLLTILNATGDFQSLRGHYEQYSILLHRELGLQPSAECRMLYEQVRGEVY